MKNTILFGAMLLAAAGCAKQEEIAAGKSGAMATAEAALRWCARLCGQPHDTP